jgi:hypothetical protein
VDDLGVELDPVELAVGRLERRDGRFGRRRQRREAGRCLVDRVAVRHPARLLVGEIPQQLPLLVDRQLRAAELADVRRLDTAAEVEHHRLHAVTDAEHRDAELEQLVAELRRSVGVHRRRPAREDQSLRRPPLDLIERERVREQL